jgi:integrase
VGGREQEAGVQRGEGNQTAEQEGAGATDHARRVPRRVRSRGAVGETRHGAVRPCARPPADALRLGPRDLVKHADGRRTPRFRRGKTNVQIEMEIVGNLAEALAPPIDRPSAHPTFVRRDDDKRYTVDGIGAMFRPYCVGTKERPVDPQYPDFGLRDVRAKGATDMYRADRGSIHKIQALLGHKSVQTTEIYLKGLVSDIVRPNEVPIIALVKK